MERSSLLCFSERRATLVQTGDFKVVSEILNRSFPPVCSPKTKLIRWNCVYIQFGKQILICSVGNCIQEAEVKRYYSRTEAKIRENISKQKNIHMCHYDYIPSWFLATLEILEKDSSCRRAGRFETSGIWDLFQVLV